MNLEDFSIGSEFVIDALPRPRRFRCTDIGTRSISAIRVDEVQIAGAKPVTLDQAAAEDAGLFDGPPYPIDELVFDEDELHACHGDGSTIDDFEP